jgi:hypothetical protein
MTTKVKVTSETLIVYEPHDNNNHALIVVIRDGLFTSLGYQNFTGADKLDKLIEAYIRDDWHGWMEFMEAIDKARNEGGRR